MKRKIDDVSSGGPGTTTTATEVEVEIDCPICYVGNIAGDEKVEFTTSDEADTLKHAAWCRDCILQIKKTKFHDYVKSAQTTDCKAELTRLLKQGPPTYLADEHCFPNVAEDAHVAEICYKTEESEEVRESALLDGALLEEDRNKLWEKLRKSYL
jgi:hypothetical protein